MEQNSTDAIILPTLSACALWEHELTGQFSDGMWENSRPYDHWQFWNGLDVLHDPTVDPKVVTTCAWKCKKTSYNIAALYPIVGERMVAIGRMAKAMYSVDDVMNDFPRYAAELMPETLEKFEALVSGPRSMSDYAHDALKKVPVELAKAYYTAEYTMKHLKADVALIKAAMKTVSL